MNWRKTISLSLAAAVCAGLLAMPAGAASVPSQSQAIQAVNALGIMVGDTSGDMMLSRTVSRAEFITMAVKATPNGDQVGQASTSPYPDVPYTHWAAGYVQAGVSAGLIVGFSDGTFRPNNQISLGEGVTIVLNLLGYTSEDFSGAYPTPQMALYHSLDLDRGLSAQNAGDILTRQDCMYLFYNLMTTNTKAGAPYINSLGYSLNAAGEIDLVALINGAMEGPVVAQGNWQSAIPFSLTGCTVYRDGKAAALSAIQTNDVVYWSPSMRTLWAYSDKAVGTIQSLTPSTSSPTSVTVAGRTYAIETAEAAFALSDLGQYGVGDVVTLLLGRDGGVAAVAGPDQADQERCGVVTKVEKTTYTDGRGNSYAQDTVTLLATDGNTYSYPCSSTSLEAGDLALAQVSGGNISLTRLSKGHAVSGTVSDDGSKVGSTPFAKDVEILDVYEDSGLRIYPSRLAGVRLDSDDVAYCAVNSSGEITQLVLKEVTGDMHHYGVLNTLTTIPTGSFSTYYTYQFDVGGVPGVLAQTTTRYPVEEGPVIIKGDLSAPDRLDKLTAVKNGTVSGNQFTAGGQRYTMADQVAVYEYRDKEYYLSSLSRVQEKGLTLTGWYDKTQQEGGLIRVIIAQ